MNAEHLHSFCIVASEGSVSAAARLLGISQPAVSRHLRLLEESSGHVLYERRGHGVTLTPRGRALLPYACNVSEALTRARDVLAGKVTPEYTRVHVGLSHHLITRLTGPLLRAAKSYGDEGHLLRMHLMEGYTPDLMNGLHSGSLEAAYILGDPGDISGLESQEVGTQELVFLVRPDDPLGREQVLSPEVLRGEALVLPSSASAIYKAAQQLLSTHDVPPGRLLEVSGPAAVRSAVLDGLGIGITIGSFVEHDVAAGALLRVPVESPLGRIPLHRLVRNSRFLLPEQQHALGYLNRATAFHDPGAVPPI